jgi:hypothetical protein
MRHERVPLSHLFHDTRASTSTAVGRLGLLCQSTRNRGRVQRLGDLVGHGCRLMIIEGDLIIGLAGRFGL